MKAQSTAWNRAGLDRWLLSYADLVTLLFAFFTTLYAAAAAPGTLSPLGRSGDGPVDPGRVVAPVQVVAASRPHDGSQTTRGRALSDAPDGLDALRNRLSDRLSDDVRLQRADIARDRRGVVVSLPERATFAVGSADVTAEARPLIARVIAEVREGGYPLRIEGHTDNVPIRTARFPSNWELSTARAGAVVAYLVRDLGMAPDRLSAAGYAEFHPRVANDSATNRARNRRIDIVILERAEVGEPTR